jgi:hypothetical protein
MKLWNTWNDQEKCDLGKFYTVQAYQCLVFSCFLCGLINNYYFFMCNHNLRYYFGRQANSYSLVYLASTSFIFNPLLIISKPLNHEISFSFIKKDLFTRWIQTYKTSFNIYYLMMKWSWKHQQILPDIKYTKYEETQRWQIRSFLCE